MVGYSSRTRCAETRINRDPVRNLLSDVFAVAVHTGCREFKCLNFEGFSHFRRKSGFRFTTFHLLTVLSAIFIDFNLLIDYNIH